MGIYVRPQNPALVEQLCVLSLSLGSPAMKHLYALPDELNMDDQATEEDETDEGKDSTVSILPSRTDTLLTPAVHAHEQKWSHHTLFVEEVISNRINTAAEADASLSRDFAIDTANLLTLVCRYGLCFRSPHLEQSFLF